MSDPMTRKTAGVPRTGQVISRQLRPHKDVSPFHVDANLAVDEPHARLLALLANLSNQRTLCSHPLNSGGVFCERQPVMPVRPRPIWCSSDRAVVNENMQANSMRIVRIAGKRVQPYDDSRTGLPYQSQLVDWG